MSGYAARRDRLLAQFAARGEGAVGLGKQTSNLFRDRSAGAKRRLDVREFDHVLGVGPGWVEAEGMTTYETLAAATLAHDSMPAVVPQLKTITLGGAVAGVGIEATSFRHGLVHESVLELDVLTGEGTIVTCTPDNEHRDLFRGFPNSYGTLGYALRVKAKTLPVLPYVAVEHRRYVDGETYFRELGSLARSDADFLDGVVFGAGECYASIGRFRESAPRASDYTYEHVYYRSIREHGSDFLTASGYLWRWDTDWFWCSKNLGAQNPLVRRLLGRARLNSRTYTRIMRWNSRWGLTRRLDGLLGRHPESVIQDVDIPIEHAAQFLDFLLREIRVLPIWICPIGTGPARFDLYPLEPGRLYINFGFWDVVRTREPHPEGHFNRLIEAKAEALKGVKSLYSDSYYSPEAFWRTFDRAAYARLKARYDPQGALGDLYQKCVLRR